jgi:UDP-3-O-[3-hydroxymyristoyl] glucosamine N-acyltransferase
MQHETETGMISRHAVVETDRLGDNVRIDEFAVVRAGAVLGSNVVIHPHVVIAPGVVLGDGVEVFPGAFLGKEPKGAGALARPPVFERRVQIGANSSIGPHAIIYYDVVIGSGTLIGDAASIREQCTVGDSTVVGRHVTLNYAVRVGSRTKIMDHTWLAGNMRVGDDVFISGGVLTANDNAIGTRGYDDAVVGPTIEEGTMVGVGATLLPGVVLGRGSVVGAGAVVTKDVESGTRVMGVPARPIHSAKES